MDRMLVVVFDNETKAYEGKRALQQLNDEGSITVYAFAVLTKKADGSSSIKQGEDVGPIGTLLGTSLGSLIGLLGGPAGVAIGATAGFGLGSAADIDNARIGDDFLTEISQKLTPNKVAVVAEINEEWTTPVDTRMEALGGIVFRRALSEARKVSNQEEVDAMKADLAQMKAEHAQANADRKARLQEKMSQLDSKIKTRLEKAEETRKAVAKAAQAKAEVLKGRAAAARAKVS